MDDRRRFSALVAKGEEPRSTILQAIEFAHEFLAEHSLDARLKIKVAILVEELVGNALRHGGKDRDRSLWLMLGENNGSIRLELEDDGAPYDPSSVTAFAGPDPRTGGGIGLAFVHAWSTDLDYARDGERNTLKLAIR